MSGLDRHVRGIARREAFWFVVPRLLLMGIGIGMIWWGCTS